MTTKEFIIACSSGGYSTKKQAEEYCKTHPKDDWDVKDFELVYKWVNRATRDGHKSGWREMNNHSRCTINDVYRGLAGSNKF